MLLAVGVVVAVSEGGAMVLTGLIAAVVGLVGIGVPLWVNLRRGRDTLYEARDNAVEARASAVEARHAATAVQVQLQPNGGSSFRDGLDEVRAVVRRLEQGQADIGALADRMAITADRIDSRTLLLDQRLTSVERKLTP